jgi:hypothetical protein
MIDQDVDYGTFELCTAANCYSGGRRCAVNQGCNSTTGECIDTETTTSTGLLAIQYSTYFGERYNNRPCVQTPWTSTAGRYVLQQTSTTNLHDFNWKDGASQEYFTWQITGWVTMAPAG